VISSFILIPGNDHFAEKMINEVVSGVASLIVKPETRKEKKASQVTGRDFDAFNLSDLNSVTTSWKGADADLVHYVTNQLKPYKDKILQNKKILITERSNLE
jgi:hypothetical protein